MESTEAINIPVKPKDAHIHEDCDNDENIINNVQQEPITIDPSGTNIENAHSNVVTLHVYTVIYFENKLR